MTKTIERGGPLRASTRSLHDLGLDNYPNPEFPEASRLTRKEEKSALQNLNNRLAGNYLIVLKINQFEIGRKVLWNTLNQKPHFLIYRIYR